MGSQQTWVCVILFRGAVPGPTTPFPRSAQALRDSLFLFSACSGGGTRLAAHATTPNAASLGEGRPLVAEAAASVALQHHLPAAICAMAVGFERVFGGTRHRHQAHA
jgi:hypothetical protein